MAFYDKFPYTNFQEINLDTMLKDFSEIRDNREASEAAAEAAEQSRQHAANSASAAAASAESAAESAETAGEASEVISGALSQIAINTQQIGVNRDAIQAANARIDTIVPSGTPTEGNTELIDIRTGADGIAYQSAGEAVRTQAANNAIVERIKTKWIKGYLASNGTISSDPTYDSFTSQLIPCVPGDSFRINVQYTARHLAWAAYVYYDEDGLMVGSRVTCITGANVTAAQATWTCDVPNTRYIRISNRQFEDAYPTIYHTHAYYQSEFIGGFLEATKNNIQNLYNQHIKGVINADGTIGAGDSSIEYVTDFIPVSANQIFFQHAITDGPGWMAFCTYDADRVGMARTTTLFNSFYAHDGYHTTQEFKVPAGAVYIRACTRTNGRQQMTLVQENVNKANDAWVKKMKYFDGNADYAMAKTAPVRSCAHRGIGAYFPENTIPCFRSGRMAGFPYIETDVRFTSDNVPVILHDESINRTARNVDGSTIEETVNIADITYSEALNYDFGVWKGSQFAGTRIPSLDQALACFRRLGMDPILELKTIPTTEQMNIILDTIKKNDLYDRTIIQSFYNGALQVLIAIDPAFPINKIANADISVDPIELCQSFQTGQNSVGLNMQYAGISEDLANRCKNAGLRLEAYTCNDYTVIKNLPEYVSAVYSDSLIASAVWMNDELLN